MPEVRVQPAIQAEHEGAPEMSEQVLHPSIIYEQVWHKELYTISPKY